MALSYRQYTADGVQTDFSYSGILLLPTDVVSLVNQFVVYSDSVVVSTNDYTVNSGAETIDFDVAPDAGAVIRIERSTEDTARYVDYTNGATLSASVANLDANQLFFLIQEIIDGVNDSITQDTDGIWNARNIRIKNVAVGEQPNDAVTMAQLTAAMAGVSPMAWAGNGYFTATGDGVEDTYSLTDGPSNQNASDYLVFINGLRQIPTSAYTVTQGTPDSIVFTAAPALNDYIEVVWIEGTLLGGVAQGSIDNDSVADDAAIEITKLDAGTDGDAMFTDGTTPTWRPIESADISDIQTTINATPLSSLANPTANVDINNYNLKNVAAPTASHHAVNLSYVQANYKRSYIVTGSFSGSNISLTTPYAIGAMWIYASGTGNSGVDAIGKTYVFNGNETLAHSNGFTVARVSSSQVTITNSFASGTYRILLIEA